MIWPVGWEVAGDLRLRFLVPGHLPFSAASGGVQACRDAIKKYTTSSQSKNSPGQSFSDMFYHVVVRKITDVKLCRSKSYMKASIAPNIFQHSDECVSARAPQEKNSFGDHVRLPTCCRPLKCGKQGEPTVVKLDNLKILETLEMLSVKRPLG